MKKFAGLSVFQEGHVKCVIKIFGFQLV